MSCEYLSAITDSYSNILSYFKIHHSVHPEEPAVPAYSEFFEVTSRRRIRLIHIKPGKTEVQVQLEKRLPNDKENERNHRVSSGEYWFTCWNRPLRTTACNCSFRRSQRFSTYSDKLSIPPDVDINSITFSVKHMKRVSDTSNCKTKIENYVEKLITNALLIAFQECVRYKTDTFSEINIHSKSNGIINAAFNSKDESVLLSQSFVNLTKQSDSINQSCNPQNYTKSFCSISQRDDEVLYRTKPSKAYKKQCGHESTTAKITKPVVLLLHGIGSSAEVWWNVLQCLVNAGHEVLAPDMLGHGYSSIPNSSAAYTFKNLLKDIITVFDKYIGCSEMKQCIVIGHSFGCSLAGALARYRAQQIVQLVLISGGGPTPLAPLVSTSESSLFNCLQIMIKPLLFCGIKRTMFFSSRGKHFEVCDVESAVPSHVLQYISEGQHWPEGDAAFHRRILIPTLLVHGLQDTHVTLVQECEMERTIPRSFLEVIPTAGHMAMLETPSQLCHMLLCFINWWTK